MFAKAVKTFPERSPEEYLTYLKNRLTEHQLIDTGISAGQPCPTCVSMSKEIQALENQIKEKAMQCPICKCIDGQFLQEENGIFVRCQQCKNKFRKIDGKWVHYEVAPFSYTVLPEDSQASLPPGFTLSKSKYSRLIGSIGKQVEVDVYDVLKAFRVTCPARQHAIKKLLAAGQRGSKPEKQDLQEAIDSINRSIQMLGPDEDFDELAAKIANPNRSELK